MTSTPSHAPEALARRVFCLLLAFGALFLFLVPPVQPPDEDSHLIRAVMVAEGQFGVSRDDTGWGQSVPVSLRDYVLANSPMRGHPEIKYPYEHWTTGSYVRSEREPRVHHAYSGMLGSALLYLPQAAGILVGKALYRTIPGVYFNWPSALYFARLGNLLAFAAGFAVAITLMPQAKSVFSFVMLMPMSVSIAASASYDVTTIISCVVFFSASAALASSSSAPRWLWVLAVLSAFFVGHAKAVYAPLVLGAAVLMLGRPWRGALALSSASLLAAVLGAAVSIALAAGKDAPSDAEAFSAQAGFLFEHPGAVPALLINTAEQYGTFYFVSVFANFGSLDTNVPLPMVAAIWGLLLFAIVSDAIRPGCAVLDWPARLVLVLACATSVVLIMLALYVRWTSISKGVGATVVDGVQGRYFIPLLPILGACLSYAPSRLRQRAGQSLADNLLAAQLAFSKALLAVALLAIVLRYYMPAA
jgi:uncharacterized membrane protein